MLIMYGVSLPRTSFEKWVPMFGFAGSVLSPCHQVYRWTPRVCGYNEYLQLLHILLGYHNNSTSGLQHIELEVVPALLCRCIRHIQKMTVCRAYNNLTQSIWCYVQWQRLVTRLLFWRAIRKHSNFRYWAEYLSGVGCSVASLGCLLFESQGSVSFQHGSFPHGPVRSVSMPPLLEARSSGLLH